LKIRAVGIYLTAAPLLIVNFGLFITPPIDTLINGAINTGRHHPILAIQIISINVLRHANIVLTTVREAGKGRRPLRILASATDTVRNTD
jgi:hypothetical protein